MDQLIVCFFVSFFPSFLQIILSVSFLVCVFACRCARVFVFVFWFVGWLVGCLHACLVPATADVCCSSTCVLSVSPLYPDYASTTSDIAVSSPGEVVQPPCRRVPAELSDFRRHEYRPEHVPQLSQH